MTVELVALPNPRGEPYAALAYGARRPRGIGLAIAHGYSSSKHNLDALCSFLASHGFASVSVDLPGHKFGGSGGRLNGPDDLVGALDAAAARLRREHAIVYAAGHSLGASTALVAAGRDVRYAGAIAIATGLERPAALRALGGGAVVDLRARYVDGATLPEIAEVMEPIVVGSLPGLAGRPTLLVAADRDALVSRRCAEALAAAVPPPVELVFVESDHTSAAERSREAVLAWLNARHPRA